MNRYWFENIGGIKILDADTPQVVDAMVAELFPGVWRQANGPYQEYRVNYCGSLAQIVGRLTVTND